MLVYHMLNKIEEIEGKERIRRRENDYIASYFNECF
jgi:hypothetical protein